jgi:D-inositol-3-phosphate glycosyltransferase
MKKRIAMISYHTCPLASEEGKESGGMNVYVLELGKELVKLGHIVDVFTRSQDSNNFPKVEVVPGFRVFHLNAGPQKPIYKKELMPFFDQFVDSYFKVCQINNMSHDIIHAHYYLSGLIGQKIQQKLSRVATPMIQSFHTLALMKNLVARDESEKEDSVRIAAEFSLCANSSRIIATSESDRGYLEYLYDTKADHISVIPPGVNTSLFKPMDMDIAKKHIQITANHKLILFVGRIEPLKGIDMLMYAMKIVTKRNPDIPVCLCIVGGDISQPQESWSKTLQALNGIRHTLNLATTVTFVGQKTQEELLYYYNAAEMVVMPSHYESFGMAALEAMSCGVPVITTNAAGISSLIDEKHASLVTSVNNPLLLANQIEYLLKTPEKRVAMSEDIRSNVSDLSWKTAAQKVSALYESVTL